MSRSHKIISIKNFQLKVLLMFFVFSFSKSWGQSIWDNPITGTNPNTANPYTTGQTVDANITVSGIGRGTGITGTAATDRYAASSWNTGALDVNDYFEFTLNPCSGGYISFVNFVYTGQASGTGPTNFAIRSSLDSYVANIGAPNAGGTTINLSGASYQNITTPITFRFYAWGGSGGTYSINSFVFNGTASCTPPCTAPTTSISTTSQTLCTSTSTSFSVGTNAASPTYVWEMSSNNSTWIPVSNGTPIGASYTNTNTATLSYTTGSIGVTYYYHCLVTDGGTCTATSSTNTITVNSPITLIGPTDKTICTGTSTSFTTSGSGTNPKVWQYSSDAGITFTNVPADAVHSGTNTATLSLTTPSVNLNGYVYQCIVSVPGCSAVTSNTALLTVYQTPSTPPTPTAVPNPACSSSTLSAMSSTVSGATWYWQGTTAAGTSTTNPTSSYYVASATGTYYVRARTDGSSCLSSTSSSIAITINQPPAITSNPIDQSKCTGTNTTFSVAATGTGLSYVWQYNTGSGFANVPNSAPYSNVTSATMSITNITAGMAGYQFQCIVSGASPCSAATSSIATLVITAAGDPSTASSSPLTSNIACNGFNLSWTNGSGSNRLVVVSTAPVAGSPTDGVSYTASSTYTLGSSIAANEYVVYNGTGNSVFVNGLNPATTYYYSIFEFNGCSAGYLTSGIIPNGNETTTTCSAAAGVTAVYIDACSGGCSLEGPNELIWGTSGSYGMVVNNNGPSLNYNSTSPPTTNFISTYGLYSSNLSDLNLAAGSCTNTVFVDPNTQGYIPPNSTFLIAHSCMCSPSAYDFSGLCNSGPIYVVFGNNAVWPCNSGGIFGNNGTGIRYFNLDMNAWNVPLNPIYSYSPSALVGGDGAYVLFNPTGGATTSYGNSACVVPLVFLPIELIDFYATQNGSKNNLVWKVSSESKVLQYIIEKSDDGVIFTELSRVNANRIENAYQIYLSEDNSPNSGITYYRLSTLESSNKINHHKIIDIDRSNKDWKSLLYQSNDELILEFKNAVPKNAQFLLFDLSGKLLFETLIEQSSTKINTTNLADGIYFAKIESPYKTENFKIIIRNDK